MRNLSVKHTCWLAALSTMTLSAFAGAAQQTVVQLPSARDQQSSWIVTTPAHKFDPKTGRRLVGHAHRQIDETINVSRPYVAERYTTQTDAATTTSNTSGLQIPSFPTFFTSFVNNQQISPYPGWRSFLGFRFGTDPQLTDGTTTIPTYVIPVVIKATDGTIYDPTVTVPGLGASTVDMQLASPVFQKTDLQFAGQDFGTTQLLDSWVRAGDWSNVSTKPNYHLMLANPTPLPTLQLTPTDDQFQVLNFGPGSGLYGSTIYVLDINYLDAQLRAYIDAAHANGSLAPTGIPIFLTSYNIEASGAGGYHDDVDNQVYTWVGYFVSSAGTGNSYDDNTPSPLRDGTIMEHELAEMIDHPYVESGDNGACSYFGYEVGDPLEGGQNDFVLPNTTGNTYVFQDLTFYSYNIGDIPSVGINGQYTLMGTYAYPCAGM